MTRSEDEHPELVEDPHLPIARVAHEVIRSIAMSFGDYGVPAWENLERVDQRDIVSKVKDYIETPGLKPDMLTIAIRDQHTRAKDYALYGVVRGIALEQMRS